MPKDVGILCYGSSPFNAYFTPSLSSVEFPLERMIQDCVRLLLDKYANNSAEEKSICFEAAFSFRESFRPPDKK